MRITKLFNLTLMMLSFGLSAATIEGKVVNVADGDTITVLVNNNTQYKKDYKELTRQRRLSLMVRSQSSLCIN